MDGHLARLTLREIKFAPFSQLYLADLPPGAKKDIDLDSKNNFLVPSMRQPV